MSRGVGTILLNHIMREARSAHVTLKAEFLPNGRNRMMEITYRLAGFDQRDKIGETLILENSLSQVPSFPDYGEVRIHD